MRKFILALAIGMAITVSGFLSWNADAASLVLPAPTLNYSLVEKAGCSGPGQCPIGSHMVCGAYGHCGCVACGGAYYHPYAYHPYVRPYRYNY
jgi:hypothetical protein